MSLLPDDAFRSPESQPYHDRLFNNPWAHLGIGLLAGDNLGGGLYGGLLSYRQQQRYMQEMEEKRRQQEALEQQQQAMAQAGMDPNMPDYYNRIMLEQQYPSQQGFGTSAHMFRSRTNPQDVIVAQMSQGGGAYTQAPDGSMVPVDTTKYIYHKPLTTLDYGDRYGFANPVTGTGEGMAGGYQTSAPTASGAQVYTDSQTGEEFALPSPMTSNPTTGRKGIAPKDRPGVKAETARRVKEAEMEAEGRVSERDKSAGAKKQVDQVLTELATLYQTLDEMNAIVDSEEGVLSNLQASASASRTGQALGRIFGTEAQSIRTQINQKKPLLINMIRQATDMGAKGMDSEKELAFYLQAATDETADIDSNMAAISILSEAYGLGLNVDVKKDVKEALRGQAPTASPVERARAEARAELMRRKQQNATQ